MKLTKGGNIPRNTFTRRNNNNVDNNGNNSNIINKIMYVLLGLVIVVCVALVIYYVVMIIRKNKTHKIESDDNKVGDIIDENDGVVKSSLREEVFHIKENKYTFDDARNVCKAHGAKLATFEQMVNAYEQGANWCGYGWIEGSPRSDSTSNDSIQAHAYYPIQHDFYSEIQSNEVHGLKDQCGTPGLNGGAFDKDTTFGANCYGVKRDPTSDEMENSSAMSHVDLMNEAEIQRLKLEPAEYSAFNTYDGKWSAF